MRAQSVGIVYLVGDKLWIDATPVNRAMNVGDYVLHEHDHCKYWKRLAKQKAVPHTGYERFPRGRVSHNRKSGKFLLLADRCILREKKLVSAILSRMHLPAGDTETGTDDLYRCSGCKRRSH
jgi:hypothetical protein